MMKKSIKKSCALLIACALTLSGICGSAESKCGEYGGHRQKGLLHRF